MVRPDVVIEGESPGKGADILWRGEADTRGIPVDPCPMNPLLDGTHGGKFNNRNGRQITEKKPHAAIGNVVGKVGQTVGTRGHYLTNGSDDMAARVRKAGLPLAILREDGWEPLPVRVSGDGPMVDAMQAARGGLVTLHNAGFDVVAAGKAVKAALEAGKALRPHAEVAEALVAALAALEGLREGSPRLSPWVQVVEATLRPLVGR